MLKRPEVERLTCTSYLQSIQMRPVVRIIHNKFPIVEGVGIHRLAISKVSFTYVMVWLKKFLSIVFVSSYVFFLFLLFFLLLFFSFFLSTPHPVYLEVTEIRGFLRVGLSSCDTLVGTKASTIHWRSWRVVRAGTAPWPSTGPRIPLTVSLPACI